MKEKVVAFDADDTLWINETIFTSTRGQFKSLIQKYRTVAEVEKLLDRTERKNLAIFGYGIKGFTLSMIETAIEITNEEISARDIHEITAMGKDMLAHPVELLPAVESTLRQLQGNYRLMVITKGDLFDQEAKIARSGLGDLFDHIEIVSEKNVQTYQRILQRHQLLPEQFIMVGNSLKSDILPVCALGAQAVYIPFHTTWAYELVPAEEAVAYAYETASNIGELPELLTRLWPPRPA